MNKLKGFYKSNRIFVILMGISAICLIIVGVVAGFYLIDQTRGNLYGNRLNGIETVPIDDSRLKSLETAIAENEMVERAIATINGKIIYINIYLIDGRASDAQEIAIGILDNFSEDELSFYDISFIVDKTGEVDITESVFPIMGYKNINNKAISWANFSE